MIGQHASTKLGGKVLDSVTDCLELVCHVIGNRDTELLLNGVDQFVGVEAVSSQILPEGGAGHNLRRIGMIKPDPVHAAEHHLIKLRPGKAAIRRNPGHFRKKDFLCVCF